MEFERCMKCSDPQWEVIDHDTLLAQVSNDLIDMMIWFKAVVRVGIYEYRRHIPENIPDWAKINQELKGETQ